MAALCPSTMMLSTPLSLTPPTSQLRNSRTQTLKLSRPAPKASTPQRMACRASAEPGYVDYEENPKTVFPAEACDELGGEFCEVEGVGPEVKPRPVEKKPPPTPNPFAGLLQKEREYVNYDGDKTVFLSEACDNLGGEFCEPEFQKDVK
eukprot:TRINITY_DN20826_c0_g1_i1.p1 TRINITY_DN20826_c0_g1~~TRINITY_DN20826_c0_g1_i1.p1  ORF type:complete len:149 (-),score=28.26 TRINITY_DN20826_c0_g1_i1:318-764(-)